MWEVIRAMNVSQLLAVIIAVLAPLLISLFKNVDWSRRVKVLFALIVAVLVAVAVSFLQIENYWGNLAMNLPITITIVYASYTALWEKLKLPKLHALEYWLRYALNAGGKPSVNGNENNNSEPDSG